MKYFFYSGTPLTRLDFKSLREAKNASQNKHIIFREDEQGVIVPVFLGELSDENEVIVKRGYKNLYQLRFQGVEYLVYFAQITRLGGAFQVFRFELDTFAELIPKEIPEKVLALITDIIILQRE